MQSGREMFRIAALEDESKGRSPFIQAIIDERMGPWLNPPPEMLRPPRPAALPWEPEEVEVGPPAPPDMEPWPEAEFPATRYPVRRLEVGREPAPPETPRAEPEPAHRPEPPSPGYWRGYGGVGGAAGMAYRAGRRGLEEYERALPPGRYLPPRPEDLPPEPPVVTTEGARWMTERDLQMAQAEQQLYQRRKRAALGARLAPIYEPRRRPPSFRQFAERLTANIWNIPIHVAEHLRPSEIEARFGAFTDRLGNEYRYLREAGWSDWPAFLGALPLAVLHPDPQAEPEIRAKLERQLSEIGRWGIELPPPEYAHEKIADVVGGLGEFMLELSLANAILPTNIPIVLRIPLAFEFAGALEGHPTGEGFALGTILQMIQGLPGVSLATRLAKIGLESGLFAGLTAARGGDDVDVLVSALIPPVFHGYEAVRQRYAEQVRAVPPRQPDKLVEIVKNARRLVEDIPNLRTTIEQNTPEANMRLRKRYEARVATDPTALAIVSMIDAKLAGRPLGPDAVELTTPIDVIAAKRESGGNVSRKELPGISRQADRNAAVDAFIRAREQATGQRPALPAPKPETEAPSAKQIEETGPERPTPREEEVPAAKGREGVREGGPEEEVAAKPEPSKWELAKQHAEQRVRAIEEEWAPGGAMTQEQQDRIDAVFEQVLRDLGMPVGLAGRLRREVLYEPVLKPLPPEDRPLSPAERSVYAQPRKPLPPETGKRAKKAAEVAPVEAKQAPRPQAVTLPERPRTTPAKGTPERAKLDKKWDEVYSKIEEITKKVVEVEKQLERVRPGTKKQETLRARKARLQGRAYKLQSDNEELQKQKRTASLEDLYESGDEANRLAALAKLDPEYKTAYEDIKKLAAPLIEAEGIRDPEAAESIAASAANMLVSYPGIRTLQEQVAIEAKLRRQDTMRADAVRRLDEMQFLDAWAQHKYRKKIEAAHEQKRIDEILAEAKAQDEKAAKRIQAEAKAAADRMAKGKRALVEAVKHKPSLTEKQVQDILLKHGLSFEEMKRAVYDLRAAGTVTFEKGRMKRTRVRGAAAPERRGGKAPSIKELAERYVPPPRPAPPDPRAAKSAWARSLIRRINRDPQGKKVGLRSIFTQLANALDIQVRARSEQLPKKWVAAYYERGRFVRTRAESSQAVLHEMGHAVLDYVLRLDPKAGKRFNALRPALKALAKAPGSFASVKNAHEGFAEWFRRSVMNRGSLDPQLDAKVRAMLAETGVLDALDDAHLAFNAHLARDPVAQWDSYMADKPGRKTARQELVDAVRRGLYLLTTGDLAMSWKVDDPIYKAMYDVFRRLDRAERKLLRQGIEKEHYAYRALGQKAMYTYREDVDRAVSVRGKGAGLRVNVFRGGFDAFEPEQLKAMRDAGAEIPTGIRDGDVAILTNYSLADIRAEVGEKNWPAFTRYVWARTVLEDWQKWRKRYPGETENITPELLATIITNAESEHPDWVTQRKRLGRFMQQLLLIPVLSGKITPEDYVNMVKAREYYAPLPRIVEGAMQLIAPRHGSLKPFRPLWDAIAWRVTASLRMYYQNALRWHLMELPDKLGDKKGMAPEVVDAAGRIVVPLKMDPVKVAELTPEEMAKIAAQVLTAQMAQEMGVSPDEIPPEARVKPEDVNLDLAGFPVWRARKPKAMNVITLFDNGRVRFAQVEDPMLYHHMATVRNQPEWLRILSRAASLALMPIKQLIIYSPVFQWYNVWRDPVTGSLVGLAEYGDPKAIITGIYTAEGLVNKTLRTLGKGLDVPADQSAMLSRTLEAVGSAEHRQVVTGFYDVLREGVALPDAHQLSHVEKAAYFVPRFANALAKPLTLASWATGMRAASELAETTTREGLTASVARRGEEPPTEIELSRAYHISTGNFAARPGSPSWTAAARMGMFVTPGLQVFGQMVEYMTSIRSRRRFWLGILPWLAGLAIAKALIDYALMDDEDREMWRETSDEMRIRYNPIKVPGLPLMKAPFPYGLEGAVMSIAYNAVMGKMLASPTKPQNIAKVMHDRFFNVSGLTQLLGPYLQVALEAKANYSFWLGRSIVPAYMEAYYPGAPELQAYDDTRQLYVWAGKELEASPLKVEYIVRNLTGGFGANVVHLANDIITKRHYGEKSDIPFVGHMFWKIPVGYRARSVQELAEIAREAEAARQRIKSMYASGQVDPAELAELERAYYEFADAMAAMRTVRAYARAVRYEKNKPNPDYGKIRAYEEKMLRTAQQLLEKRGLRHGNTQGQGQVDTTRNQEARFAPGYGQTQGARQGQREAVGVGPP